MYGGSHAVDTLIPASSAPTDTPPIRYKETHDEKDSRQEAHHTGLRTLGADPGAGRNGATAGGHGRGWSGRRITRADQSLCADATCQDRAGQSLCTTEDRTCQSLCTAEGAAGQPLRSAKSRARQPLCSAKSRTGQSVRTTKGRAGESVCADGGTDQGRKSESSKGRDRLMSHATNLRSDSAGLSFPPERIAAGLRALNGPRRRHARRAAGTLIDCLRRFVQAGQIPLAMAVGDSAAPQTWQHYQPELASALDGRPGKLHYYYHSHASPGAAPAEHGHFHLFAQLGKDADGVAAYTHLLAIGVDARGMPSRLFTTNAWVTGETWMPANRVRALIEKMATAPAPVDDIMERWLRAQLGVFAPQIVQLLCHRDQRMNARKRSGRRPGLFEDRRMDVISQCSVSVDQQLTTIDALVH